MAKTNLKVKAPAGYTHEGAVAHPVNPLQALKRSVMSCLLWEGEFYEDGETIADRIKELVKANKPADVSALAIAARSSGKLRHVPLFLARELARTAKGRIVGDTIYNVIQRADELAEFLSIYWKDGKDQPLSAQVKLGLARAFRKFSAYDLAKYNRDGAVKLRDVLFLSHAKPKDDAQAAIWKQLIEGKLTAPDTWEVELSAGKDKKKTFDRLMAEKKLGGLAFLRNLRNMKDAGVSKKSVSEYAGVVNLARVLPFRFVSAARAVPGWEDVIEPMFLSALSTQTKLSGKTVVVVDVSGSMYGAGNISAKSDITRVDAAGALAAVLREICEDSALYATAGDDRMRIHATGQVPSRRGFAVVDLFSKKGFVNELGGGGIFLKQCLDYIKEEEKTADRIVVFTDEQDCDTKCNPQTADAFGKRNYLINVASAKNGVGYGRWTHIDGFSESVVEFIREHEASQT